MIKKGRIEISSAVLTVFVIVLSFTAIILLWLYTQQTAQVRLIVFFLSLIIVISVVVFIDQMQKRYQLHQLELQQIISQRTSELEAAQAASEAARIQAEQINRQLQASVSRANSMTQLATEADAAKNVFLADMSHEIRIPMNAIIGFSEMLAEENLTEQQKKQVKMIRDSGRYLLQLINDVLDFSKIEAGKLDVEIADCNIESVLAVVESLMRPAAIEKKLEFEIIRSEPLPEVIRTDAARLRQCLINLVSNAIRFASRGHIYIRVFWDNSGSKSFIRFDVEDAEVRTSPHQRFWPGQMQTGTGLGLTITQHIAQLLGGSLTISGETGKGSVFTLIVPTGMRPGEAAEYGGSAAAGSERKLSVQMDNLRLSGRVLIAEDSPTNQALVELLLKKLGVEAVVVENGQQAVEKAMTEKFDIVLMDIQMPVMNGYEATKQLRENGIKIPIIALTACAMKGDDEKCFAAGCSDYLPKPVDRKKLVEVLSKYLSARPGSPKSAEGVKSPANSDLSDKAGASNKPELEIDWQLLSKRVGGEELIDEIIPIFIKDNTERMKMLSKAVERNDEREIRFYAHSLNGAAATIGAARISELAKQIEAAARDMDNSKYKSLYEELNVRFTHLVEFLSKSDWKRMAQQASSRQHTKKS